jgi:hypothetical protein
MDERVYITVDPAHLWREPIRVWPFADAPIELQAYSQNGGDEDWLAFVPVGYDDLPFLVARIVHVYTMPEGDRVIIGCHS